jgi:L-malate glycosyltransferase
MYKWKIHYHSDCSFFAGCENMLINIWGSAEVRKQYDISFSYRANDRYIQGLKQRMNCNFPTFPLQFLNLPTLLSFPTFWPLLIKRILLVISYVILVIPLSIYDIWILKRLFKKINPDIIHINNGGYPGARSARTAAIAAKLAGISNIIMIVNNMAVRYKGVRCIDYPLDRLVVNSVDRFITGSIAASRRLKEVLLLPDCKLQTIHNGIALRQTTASQSETRKRLGLAKFEGTLFGVIAVLEPRKGHNVLLDAIIRLKNKNQEEKLEFKVIIEGTGALDEELKSTVKENNLGQYCLFVGEETNIMNFFSILDVLILPSINYEDFPNVVLEAMRLGKPVIASRLAGTPEQIVDGQTGLLVEPKNVKELAGAIKILANNSKLRKLMSQAGQERFNQHFTEKIAINKYLNLYHFLTN